VTNNLVHDQLAWGRALQSDDGATNVTYSGNVLYNDNYDWGSNHVDYRTSRGLYDPQLVRANYWQQGDPDSSQKGVVVTRNRLISGPRQAPQSIISNAGLNAANRSILGRRPAGDLVPNAPERVIVLYAFRRKAYGSWPPSYTGGNKALGSYTVMPCKGRLGSAPPPCGHSGGRPVTISASAFNRHGYATVPGLTDGAGYTFSVRANGPGGSSIPSIASTMVVPSAAAPRPPGAPKGLDVRAGQGLVRLLWYAPTSARKRPVLGYIVSRSGTRKLTVTGLRQLVVSNNGGRVVEVLSGMSRGRTYTFSLAAITPGAEGPLAQFRPIRLQ